MKRKKKEIYECDHCSFFADEDHVNYKWSERTTENPVPRMIVYCRICGNETQIRKEDE